MPHSNDSTLVTCAGDAEIRIFDIEYSGQSTVPSTASNLASLGQGSGPGSRTFNNVYQGVKYLSDGDTNARVYRSHGDRVKRIVTESSPYLFLSCSEDGEVRQWDLRLPSSAYPAPRGGRGFLAHRERHDSSNVPPPLISYKRYHLDLNTISCSASQPHYIALGGAHLHCFLHDRRMLGRDPLVEKGDPGSASPASQLSEHEEEMMNRATRCVRRFAPKGQKKMRRTDNGHVTACKISDANPNEMIASWSGDNIYSFDLVNTPDARDNHGAKDTAVTNGTASGKVKESGDRKRKRRPANSSMSAEGRRRGTSQPRLSTDAEETHGDLAFRIRYENGQSEDIPINDPASGVSRTMVEEARESVLKESQKRSLQIAKSVVKVRKLMFSLDASNRAESETTNGGLAIHTPSFTSVLGFAATILPEMDQIMRSWKYRVDPPELEVAFQTTLRHNRDSTRRFVQAAGTLTRVLGAKLRTAGCGESPTLLYFDEVKSSQIEGPFRDAGQIFSYDFLKAILLWLEGGPQALLQGFKKGSGQSGPVSRFPLADEAQHADIDRCLIPYLLRQARARPVPNVDASRFEKDESRMIFETETAAVIAFSHAIRIPIEDMSRAIMPASSSAGRVGVLATVVQDRKTVLKFWGFKVGRGLLMNAGEGVNFSFVDRAFGGLGISKGEDEGRLRDEIDTQEIDEPVHAVGLVNGSRPDNDDTNMEDAENDHDEPHQNGVHAIRTPDTVSVGELDSDEEMILVDDLHNEIADHMIGHENSNEHPDNEEGDEEENDDEDDDDDDENEDDEDITPSERQFIFRSASNRGRLRESVEAHVPCSAGTRQYRGHCNVKTVKDVNYFGLQDEYVVSGSDSGHVFIWDRKTSELVNILEGDSDVVNVVQGHPYEPMLAASGIDHTIKIFSPDRRAQQDARRGCNLGVSATETSHSVLSGWPRLRRPNANARPPNPDTRVQNRTTSARESEDDDDDDYENEDDMHWTEDDRSGAERRTPGLTSRKRMQDSYAITSQNDVESRGGMRDAFITVSGDTFPLRTVAMAFASWIRFLHEVEGGD